MNKKDMPYADGEVLESGEVIVYDYEDGNLIGWHKEVKKGK